MSAHTVTQTKGKAQLAWLVGGALAMGVGIWSMHFVGMLACEMPGMDMVYDVPLMVLSVVVAVLASALAGAIAGMHYIGMYSMRMSARIEWDIYLVLLSIVIALVASFGALLICIYLRNRNEKQSLLMLASTLMGIAISGMHYTGMFAATFVHDHSLVIQDENLLVTSGLSVSVIATTLLILGIALMGSIGQRVMMEKNKQAEEVLVSSEERFRLLVETVKDYAIFMVDPNGFITTWNTGAERIAGYSDEEVIGQHFHILYPRDVTSRVTLEQELAIARDQGHYESEVLHVKKNGTKFWANMVINPLYLDGKLTGFSKVTRDITQIKEAAQRMHNINEELERRVREKLPDLSRLNMLLVDDSLDNQALIKKVLQIAGAHVETANIW